MIVVVDHIRGAQRGTRSRFDGRVRICLGRHPENDVRFDGRRDIDASSRHAEIVPHGDGASCLLRDLGSSNGTWIDGHKIAERQLLRGQSVEVEFGRGGPMVRLWIGSASDALPEALGRASWWQRFLRR